MATEKIIVCGKTVSVIRKQKRNIRLSVLRTTGAIHVSAPYEMPLPQIIDFVEEHSEWIDARLAEFNKADTTAKNLRAKKTLLLFGETYALQFVKGSRFSMQLDDSKRELTIRIKNYSDDEIGRAINLAYKKQLAAYVDIILAECEKLTKEKVSGINYRTMKTKHGSSKPSKKKITLNTSLARYPKPCIRMVLIHEIVHFKEFYHNDRFKAFMTKYCPDWKLLKKQMKMLGTE